MATKALPTDRPQLLLAYALRVYDAGAGTFRKHAGGEALLTMLSCVAVTLGVVRALNEKSHPSSIELAATLVNDALAVVNRHRAELKEVPIVLPPRRWTPA